MIYGMEEFDMSLLSDQSQTTIAMNIIGLIKMMCDDPQYGINIIDEPSGYNLYISKEEMLTFKNCFNGRPNQNYIALINKIMLAATDIASIRGMNDCCSDNISDELVARFDELMEETK